MIRIRNGYSRMDQKEPMVLHEQVENGHIIGQLVRKPLPNRRPGVTTFLYHSGHRFHLTIGYDPRSWTPAEVFLGGAKIGSEMDALLDSAMILLSKLLQAGADPKELSETLGNQCIIGAVALAVARETDDVQHQTPRVPRLVRNDPEVLQSK